MSEELTGTCLCGACTITGTPAEDHMHICHCGMCRAWTGVGMMAIKMLPEKMRVNGPVKARQTSDWAERVWCDDCGSSLYYRVTAEGPHQGVAHVAAGLFPDGGGLPVTTELFVDRRMSGYAFAGDLHGVTEAEVMAMFGGDA